MAWKKYFKTANSMDTLSPYAANTTNNNAEIGYKNYQSTLPDIYVGHPNRIERYSQYESMDADTEVNGALDILAEFCTQSNLQNNTAFTVFYKEPPTDNEIKILREQLQRWYSLNKMDKRIFKMVRNALKYGDQVFIRDPETFILHWVEMNKVTKVIINETAGKEPEQYVVRDISPNFSNLTATTISASDVYTSNPQMGGTTGSYTQPKTPVGSGGRFTANQSEAAIKAENIVHLSLSEGLDATWPFGTSVLENIFKVFKQKELLEDSIIIYRVQRAPERRVFYLDVGSMPSHMAMSFVERVKNEIHQRRIPSQTGNGTNTMDATYNPMSTQEDYFFPQTAEGRGSRVETLPGAANLGEITDLRYFTNKLFRGLRIPSSYLPTGADDGTQSVTDGRVGTALIQEWRFNQYCKRLQKSICGTLDNEFKMFLRWQGFNIDSNLYELRFNEPQNFAQYKQAEIDAVKISGFTQLDQFPYLSKRFILQRYLGLTEEEMQKNEQMWNEESGTGKGIANADGLRSVGITPGAIETDLSSMEMPEVGDEEMPDLEPGAEPSTELTAPPTQPAP